MTNREMDPIQIHDPIMSRQWTLSPRFILPRQGGIEATDGTGTGSNSRQGLKDFPNVVRTDSARKHLGQGFSDLWLVALVALECLGLKHSFSISGNFHVFDASSRGDQV